jgi:two-component system, LytTR family, response regulator
MSDVFNIVPKSDFVRVHKSFVISIKHLEMIEAHQVTVNKIKIPLGASYRNDIMKIIPNELNS